METNCCERKKCNNNYDEILILQNSVDVTNKRELLGKKRRSRWFTRENASQGAIGRLRRVERTRKFER